MNEIIDFLMRHWQVSTLFFVTLVAYGVFEFMQENNSKQVSPEQAVELYNHQQAIIVDVRTAQEYADGHVLNSLHIPVDELESNIKKLQKHMQKPVVTICATGKRSLRAVNILQAQGFTQAVSVAGGIVAWQAAGLPVTK